MTIKLPPLPKADMLVFDAGQSPVEGFTKSTVEAIRREASLMALEEAAKVCDSMPTQDESGLCASAIRALRTKLEAP